MIILCQKQKYNEYYPKVGRWLTDEEAAPYIWLMRKALEISELNEMASDMGGVIKKIQSSIAIMFEHLLKIFYFRNDDSVWQWKSSVFKVLIELPRLKSTKRFPNWVIIYRVLWNEYSNNSSVNDTQLRNAEKSRKNTFDKNVHSRFINWINSSYRYRFLPTVQISDKAFFFCDEYTKWLSQKLSKNGRVSILEVSSKIDTLLKQYSY